MIHFEPFSCFLAELSLRSHASFASSKHSGRFFVELLEQLAYLLALDQLVVWIDWNVKSRILAQAALSQHM